MPDFGSAPPSGAWLKHMAATLDATPFDEATRTALRQFFEHSSAYVTGKEIVGPQNDELVARWREQRVLDNAVAAIAEGHDDEAVVLASRFLSRPAVFVGLSARMIQSGREALMAFVLNAVERDAWLLERRFGGRALLHYASGAGCLEVVRSLLRRGADPNLKDSGGHTPLTVWQTNVGQKQARR
jgi:Ankyrin repeats (many copies)